MLMANEITIPALPCASINDILEFYSALGFEITYQQTRPNNYGCVRWEDIDLHFFSMKGYDPAQSYSTCIVLVEDVETLRQSFVEGLRQHYGKLPAAGIPRITPLRNKAEGGRGFNVIDPGGNWIRISQKSAVSNDDAPQKPESSRLTKAIDAAGLLADSKGDDRAAAKLLDAALAQWGNAPAVERVQALVARAALAIRLDDLPAARGLLADVQEMSLTEADRDSLGETLQYADELAALL
jgi:hypothetical protein